MPMKKTYYILEFHELCLLFHKQNLLAVFWPQQCSRNIFSYFRIFLKYSDELELPNTTLCLNDILLSI